MRKALKVLIFGVAALFIAIQFARPARTNPAVDDSRSLEGRLNVPDEISTILQRSCNDCHSNNTSWPWYSNVAPVSWFVADHVNHGRKHLNFSDWAQYDEDRAVKLLDEICEEVEKDWMPLSSYTRIHGEAELSESDKRALCEWAGTERRELAGAGRWKH
jgi:hypothetical protein